jgi:uncharacterized protein YaaR (DUF327 family)
LNLAFVLFLFNFHQSTVLYNQQKELEKMAQLPSKNQSTFSGIDAPSKIKNNNSFNNTNDIIGASVTLSTVSMDQIESIVQKLRNRGKRLPKSKTPLTLERPFSRAQSPLTKTAISISAETLTALNFSPPLSPLSKYQSISNANLSSIKTGREITPLTSEVYQHLVPALADSYIRTGRELARTPTLSAYSTALPAHSPLSPASRQQSISNVDFPSTKTGHEVSPTPTSSEYSTAIFHCSTPPSTQHQSISNVHLSSTKTGREITPRNSETALIPARSNSSIRIGRGVSPIPKSSEYQTALSAASPFHLQLNSSLFQMLLFLWQ